MELVFHGIDFDILGIENKLLSSYPIRDKKNETQRGKVICLKPTSKFPPWNLHSYLSDPKVHTPSRSVSCW